MLSTIRNAGLAALLLMSATGPGLIASPANAGGGSSSAINTIAGERVAIHGYDPVAYFTDGAPRLGRPDLTAEHDGAVWRFATEAHRDAFVGEPERYTPVYGGYCAYGVAQGYLVKIDPEAWTIRDGRLYLNYDLGVRDTWLKDVDGYVATADRKFSDLVPAAAPD